MLLDPLPELEPPPIRPFAGVLPIDVRSWLRPSQIRQSSICRHASGDVMAYLNLTSRGETVYRRTIDGRISSLQRGEVLL